MDIPKLHKVIRLDSQALDQTFFTPEGYLIDHPILTSVGIFEYKNPDGSVRRELRLPEDVFDPESLSSYKGKPVIITHDAGFVSKDNVARHEIGTILSDGYRLGDDVRAEIVIHETDEMKRCGLKELSLGYSLDLDETPGVWNGQHYDAVQKNIRINHLALVREARAGDQARLNIDGRDTEILKGAKSMRKNTKRADGSMNPEEFAAAIEAFKARRAQRKAEKNGSEGKPNPVPAAQGDDDDEEGTPTAVPAAGTVTTAPVTGNPAKSTAAIAADDGDTVSTVPGSEPVKKPETEEEKVAFVKDRRDRRDSLGDPEDIDCAHGMIAEQDDDIETLLSVIESLLAKKDFDDADEPAIPADPDKKNGEGNEPAAASVAELPAKAADCSDDMSQSMNADSIDSIIRERVRIIRIGDKMNLDGLDAMPIIGAKKAVIAAVRPAMRLDGRSESYINAAFDMAASEIAAAKNGTNSQRKQMFNKDAASVRNNAVVSGSAAARRQAMIDGYNRKENK